MNDFYRSTAISTGHVVFRCAQGWRHGAGHPGDGLAAEHHSHRRCLSFAPVSFDENTPMLHGIDPETHTVPALHHPAIHADVDPAFIRVADNDVVRGADVTTAVTGVPEGRGKGFEIDIVAFLNAFQYRPVFDDFGGNQRGSFALFTPEAEQFKRMNAERQVQRETKPPHRLDGVGADSIACRITRDLIEDGHRTAALTQELDRKST